MTHRRIALTALVGIALVSTGAAAASSVQPFALVSAANDGGSDRTRLEYALSSSERLGGVIVEALHPKRGWAARREEPRVRRPA